MSPMLKRLRFLFAFLLGSAWFSLFQIWGAFPDPDAFFHAKFSGWMFEHGLPLSFPWLDLTALHPGFHDQHLLFHVFLLPFVKLFGTLPGAQIAAVVLGGVFAVVAMFVFERLSMKPAWFWTAVLVALPPMMMRLSLGKASPLAIGLFLLGIDALVKRRPFWAFIVGIIYALTHGGWSVLLGAQVVLIAGSWIYSRFIDGKIERIELGVLFATAGGCLLGTFAHPHFPDNLSYLWVQIFQIGVATPIGRVFMGSEWYPYRPLELAVHFSLIGFLGCLLIVGFVVARKAELGRLQARLSIGLGLLAAILVAMTFKSARFVEYLAPVVVLWMASLFSQIDVGKLVDALRKRFRFAPHVLVVLMIFIVGKGAFAARASLEGSAKPFERFGKAMEVVSQEVKNGERLFHSDWSQFPLLWSKNDRIRYVAGLDPVFLLQKNPEVSDAYTALTIGANTSTAYETIRELFGANIAFVERPRAQKLEEILRKDERFLLIYEDEEVAVFRLVE